jgi:hypothetical protein
LLGCAAAHEVARAGDLVAQFGVGQCSIEDLIEFFHHRGGQAFGADQTDPVVDRDIGVTEFWALSTCWPQRLRALIDLSKNAA